MRVDQARSERRDDTTAIQRENRRRFLRVLRQWAEEAAFGAEAALRLIERSGGGTGSVLVRGALAVGFAGGASGLLGRIVAGLVKFTA